MALVVRAVYEGDRQLRLLDPVELEKGQEVSVTIEQDERAVLKSILGDTVQWSNPDDDSNAWVEEMADEIDRAFQGDPPLSQYIIEDRGEA